MKIAITANQPHIDGDIAQTFSECPYLVFVDSKTMQYEAMENPHKGGTVIDEISSAQVVAGKAVTAVMTGRMGLNAGQMLSLEGIKVFTGVSGKIHGAVDAYKSGRYHNYRPAHH